MLLFIGDLYSIFTYCHQPIITTISNVLLFYDHWFKCRHQHYTYYLALPKYYHTLKSAHSNAFSWHFLNFSVVEQIMLPNMLMLKCSKCEDVQEVLFQRCKECIALILAFSLFSYLFPWSVLWICNQLFQQYWGCSSHDHIPVIC